MKLETGKIAVLLILVVLGCGCANVRITDPERTATEQFLLSQAVVKAVNLLSYEAIHGRTVFLDSENFAAIEQEFVLSEFRAKLLNAGIRITTVKEDAEIIIELRSAGLGIDRYESLFGIPSLTLPSAATSNTVNILTPELAITKKIRQVGFASISYVAYWADNGQIVASSGPAIGKTYREDWWILGFGPSTVGTIPPVDYKYE